MKLLFPKENYYVLSPSSYTISERDLYILRIGLPILLQGNMWTDPGEYVNRSQTHECGNWDWGHAIPRKGTHKWDFPGSVGGVVRYNSPAAQRFSTAASREMFNNDLLMGLLLLVSYTFRKGFRLGFESRPGSSRDQFIFDPTLKKRETQFSSYIRKSRRERLQSHIWLTASSYMTKFLRISSYLTLEPLPFEFPHIWGKFSFFFISADHHVYNNIHRIYKTIVKREWVLR